MKAIELIETRVGCSICEKEPRIDVCLFGKKIGQLYFNMRGYIGFLPIPADFPLEFKKLTIGEKPISVYKREVAVLNKEWARFPR